MKSIAEFKDKHRAILHNLLPADEKAAFCENDIVNVLVDRDHIGRRILIVHCGCKKPQHYFLLHLNCILTFSSNLGSFKSNHRPNAQIILSHP